MIDLPLRILLTVTLVLWSPAWCCCALRATLDGELEYGEGAGCQGRWGGVEQTREATPGLPPCCLARIAALPDHPEDDDAATSGCCNEDSHCNCGDRPDELIRLDTAGKATIAPLERIDHAVITRWRDAAERPRHVVLRSRGPDHFASAPPRTLFAQRCMLLT